MEVTRFCMFHRNTDYSKLSLYQLCIFVLFPIDKSLRYALKEEMWGPESILTPLEKAIEWYELDYELAASPDKTAAEHQDSSTDFGKNEHIVNDSRGYNYVIECLAKEVFSLDKTTSSWTDDRLKLNTTVVRIKNAGFLIEVNVSTPSPARYICDYVIVTVSLGVLQDRAIEFSPPLPELKAKAIDEFGFGRFVTIFLKFDTLFWIGEEPKENFIYASDERGYYPAYVNLSIHYPNDADWYVLIVTVTGDLARRVEEEQTKKETEDQIMAILKEMYQKKNPNVAIPDPVETVIPKWGVYPQFKGAYSYWPPGFSDYSFSNMIASVDDRIFFAGEAMSYDYYGFLHGSYLSGEDIARCIAGKTQNPPVDSGTCPSKSNIIFQFDICC